MPRSARKGTVAVADEARAFSVPFRACSFDFTRNKGLEPWRGLREILRGLNPSQNLPQTNKAGGVRDWVEFPVLLLGLEGRTELPYLKH
jgi:hypothetical protein